MKILFWYLTALFLFSSLYLTKQFNSIGNIAIALLILMSIPLILLLRENKFKIHLPTLILMYCFMLCCTLSALYNTDINLIIDACVILVLYMASFIILPSLKKVEINKLVFKAIFFSTVPIVFIPFFFDGLSFGSYRGIFYNPNSFGTIVATMFAALFALLLFKLEGLISGSNNEKHRKKKMLIQVLLLFFIFFLIILSGSRTSSLSVGIVVLVGFVFLTLSLIRAKKFATLIIKAPLISIIGIAMIAMLFKFTPIYEYLYFNILYKFQRKSGDLLDGRVSTWQQTINEAGLFGKGSDYFREQTSVAAHNTFISILGEYGWLSLIVFVLFLITITFYSIKLALTKSEDQYKYLPLMLLLCFVSLSIAEIMIFKLSMLALFFSAGSTIKRKEISEKSVMPQKESLHILKSKRTRRKLVLK